MIVILLLLLTATTTCPTSVPNELELLAQPIDCFRSLYNHLKFDNHKILKMVNERLQTYQRMLQ
jgi:hypothetical protein